jgi:sulfide:quinone oxidoreductase
MAKSGRTVLVLGGGVGGVVAARRLRQRLGDDDRVVLVDREPNHLFQSSLLWLLVGRRRPDQIQRPLGRLEGKGIEFVQGEVEELDAEGRRVRVEGSELTADAMIISLGAELAPESVPGLSEAGHNLYGLAGTIGFRDALQQFRGGRVGVVTAAPAYKCPAAPYEAAMLVNDHLRRRGLKDTRVDVYAAEPGPMGTAGPEVSAAMRQMVEDQGIGYHPEHQVESADPAARTLSFSNGATADYDLLLYVPPHRAPAVVRQAGLTGPSGWISSDPETLRTEVDGVYAIGDIAGIPIPSGKSLPKSGVFAHRQAEVVAENLAAEWAGGTPDQVFDGTGACFIETGSGRAGYGAGDFYRNPSPHMKLRSASRLWHLGKVAFERYWFWKWF